jgi:hypothetical protein
VRPSRRPNSTTFTPFRSSNQALDPPRPDRRGESTNSEPGEPTSTLQRRVSFPENGDGARRMGRYNASATEGSSSGRT